MVKKKYSNPELLMKQLSLVNLLIASVNSDPIDVDMGDQQNWLDY